jgi:hypothetical protein
MIVPLRLAVAMAEAVSEGGGSIATFIRSFFNRHLRMATVEAEGDGKGESDLGEWHGDGEGDGGSGGGMEEGGKFRART